MLTTASMKSTPALSIDITQSTKLFNFACLILLVVFGVCKEIENNIIK
jgi:hypothetical protein